jgi:flavorubredoxin
VPPAAPAELVPGRLYAIGGCVALDGRVSWVPAGARGFQPVNAYVLIEGADVLLVDTSIALHEAAVIEQLEQLVAPTSKVSVFLTRAAYECVGNLEPITRRFPVTAAYTGGSTNPFDAFDVAHTVGAGGAAGRPVERRPVMDRVEIGPHRHLEILTPAVKMLPTFWAYDSETATLFTSDTFAYGAFPTPEYAPVVDEDNDRGDLDSVRDYMSARFWWLRHLASDQLREDLDSLFAAYPVERIAPTYGGILTGAGVVRRHLDLMRRVISPVLRAPTSAAVPA